MRPRLRANSQKGGQRSGGPVQTPKQSAKKNKNKTQKKSPGHASARPSAPPSQFDKEPAKTVQNSTMKNKKSKAERTAALLPTNATKKGKQPFKVPAAKEFQPILNGAVSHLSTQFGQLRLGGDTNKPCNSAAGSLQVPACVNFSARTRSNVFPEPRDTFQKNPKPDMAISSVTPNMSLEAHRDLLEYSPQAVDIGEMKGTPIFTARVRDECRDILDADDPFPQYGLLAGATEGNAVDKRVFYNTAAPSSVFVCGSQGGGKSHTLSCLLENCFIQSKAAILPRPLTGIVFHYDTFVSERTGTPCEAAYLASSDNIKVRVLCAPTNVISIKNIYSSLPNVTVEELRIRESDLNTKRMMELMAVNGGDHMPLYMHVVSRILKELRLQQQERNSYFNYQHFLRMVENEPLIGGQKIPLQQRLDTLESFMVHEQVKPGYITANAAGTGFGGEKKGFASKSKGNDWIPMPAQLTIVDMSCPCITPEMACSLFNICLSLFLEQTSSVGRVVALDEAHKYMSDSVEASTLTDNLLSCIRLQRHIAARVFIATQEPTISPALLDLCSVTIVHRFSSPDWLNTLKKHIAGVSTASRMLRKAEEKESLNKGEKDTPESESSTSSGSCEASTAIAHGKSNSISKVSSEKYDMKRFDLFASPTRPPPISTEEGIRPLSLDDSDPSMDLFSKIVGLRQGEALMFAPSAVLDVRTSSLGGRQNKEGPLQIRRLDHEVLKIRVRARITQDGGKSIMAN
ncbi:hypothetical protein MKZ38_003488 [Zalerion maritima]|uniref:P-loop containing nucleoside triphosphate hydrolase n=1 Tax=Zalerion maritima TaxID=339359 RepID=A0AAD5WWM0_9PEZI|nr:hypothetical protein MKZ38_003488 [Zalerion maritima]